MDFVVPLGSREWGLFMRNALVLQAFNCMTSKLSGHLCNMQVEFLSKCGICWICTKAGEAPSVVAIPVPFQGKSWYLCLCADHAWTSGDVAAPVFSTFHKQMSTNQNEALAHRVSSSHCLVELLPSSNRWKGPCWVLAQSVWSKCHLKFILSTLPLPQTHIDHHRPCRTEGWKIRLGSMFVWGYSWPRYFMSAGKAPFYQLGKDPELATRDTSRCL